MTIMAQDDEDDYMSMNFAETETETVKHETTAQRRARKQREVNTTWCSPTLHFHSIEDFAHAKLIVG